MNGPAGSRSVASIKTSLATHWTEFPWATRPTEITTASTSAAPSYPTISASPASHKVPAPSERRRPTILAARLNSSRPIRRTVLEWMPTLPMVRKIPSEVLAASTLGKQTVSAASYPACITMPKNGRAAAISVTGRSMQRRSFPWALPNSMPISPIPTVQSRTIRICRSR